MENMGNSVILFRIEVNKNNGGFAQASNFITKIINKEAISTSDVCGITSKIIRDGKQIAFSEHKACALIENKGFLSINKPHKIFEGIENQRLEFGLVIDDNYLEDTVSILPYILIKLYFRTQGILAVIQGVEKHFYPMQLLLHSIIEEDFFANSLYYYFPDKKTLKALDKRKKVKIRAFYPVQIVNEKSFAFLNSNLQKSFNFPDEQTGKSLLMDCFKDDADLYMQADGQLKDVCYALYEERKHFEALDKEKLADIFWAGNTLAFILYVFLIQSKNREAAKHGQNISLNINDVVNDYQYVTEYALGILQLLENIVFHSGTHSGIFAMRLYNTKKDSYLKTKFPEKQEASYLEVMVVDYQGSNHCDNIATRFIKNLDAKESPFFTSLTPWDLFAYGGSEEYVSDEVKRGFQKYYENYENLGRHYGLKVFRNMVIKNHGAFHFYSCTSHEAKEREYGGIDSSRKKYETFPGTGYDILLPAIGHRENLSVSIMDNYNEYEDFGVHIKEYAPFIIVSDKEVDVSYRSQEGKEQKIDELALFFQTEITSKEQSVPLTKAESVHSIGYYSVGGLEDEQAELIFKSLLKLALRIHMPDIVLYNCSDVFTSAFRRNVDTFFEKIGVEDVYISNPFCIALYAQNGEEEAVIFPNSKINTYRANMTAEYSHKKDWMRDWKFSEDNLVSKARYEKIPYDILFELPDNDGKCTIFEKYVKTILNKDIQKVEYGCRLEDTHMRLGSMVHVSSFYEAEILFHNRYFVSRFAFQIALNLYREEQVGLTGQLTICSYGMYSEMLINQLIQILCPMLGRKEEEIDYAILEREMNEDTWIHNDRFRYSGSFKNKNVRKAHFKERQIITIVPINSTLKTQDKLIEIFCAENDIDNKNNFCANFSLILVGAPEGNEYWLLDTENKKCHPKANYTSVAPAPVYFVNIPVPYFETNRSTRCTMCFPDDPIDEKPLIEVNEYSTVPNQSIGLISEPTVRYTHDMYQKTFQEQKDNLNSLASSLIYTHIRRKSNHFLYYFDTEKFFLENKGEIEKWLWKISQTMEQDALFTVTHFHILFTPAHYSNANFIDSVSRYVFHEAVLVIQINIDKEYRENVETKYSYLGLLLQHLGKDINVQYTIHAHFIDDSIITGKTYQRMYSLAQSIFEKYGSDYSNIKMLLFDRIFVLIDRNSDKSKLQYIVGDCTEDYGAEAVSLEKKYFAYKNLRIPSIRNRGDSCIICQLEKESEALSKTSATKEIMGYWIKRANSFLPRTVAKYQDELEEKYKGDKDREEKELTKERKNFRRMYCYHVANTFLTEKTHGNQSQYALREIIHLLLESMEFFQDCPEESLEYVLSYLKVISRPFLVYHKEIKEAIFRLLLLLVSWLIENKQNNYFSENICCNKDFKDVPETLTDFGEKLDALLQNEKNKKDFLLVCMKQLMELKSNYFIRKENMQKLTGFISSWDEENKVHVNQRYLYYVKKLVGIGNDTQKSIWLEGELQKIIKSEDPEKYLQKNILRTLILENIKAYYDGVERLSRDSMVNTISDIEKRVGNIKYKDFKHYIEEEGIQYRIIWNSIELLRFLENFDSNENGNDKLRGKYYELATYACNILEADKVYILIEASLECEGWKQEFTERLREIAKSAKCLESMTKQPSLRQEYLIISASQEEQPILDVPIKVTQNIETSSREMGNEYFDGQQGYFVWKIGDASIYPVIVYAEFCPDSIDEYKLMRNSRRLLMLQYKLRSSVFSDSVISYLHDIVKAENNAIRLSFFKSVSHTPEDIRKQQYYDLVSDGREEYFPSHIVTLLSDLKISETYRRSLERDYYSGTLGIKFKEFFAPQSVLSSMHGYYVIDGMTQKHAKIDIISKELAMIDEDTIVEGDSLIPEGQKVACNGYANGVDELMLLLMALIENAASKGKTEFNGDINCVKVFLSKTRNGNLRILNEVSVKSDVEKINFYLKRPPQPKDGISIWSISRYLLSLGCIVVHRVLTYCEQITGNGKVSSDERDKVIICINKVSEFINGDIKVKVDCVEKGGRHFFSIELPVFEDTYQNFLECMEE